MNKCINLSPGTQGKTFIQVRCYCDFEGHGRASETWEEHWEIFLPLIPGYWQSTEGWKRGTYTGMIFHDRTWNLVWNKARSFLEWYGREYGTEKS
jgi:hypothetical protein